MPEAVGEERIDNLLPLEWPDAAPPEGTEFILSVSCGNSHFHWARHGGPSTKYEPTLYWK